MSDVKETAWVIEAAPIKGDFTPCFIALNKKGKVQLTAKLRWALQFTNPQDAVLFMLLLKKRRLTRMDMNKFNVTEHAIK